METRQAPAPQPHSLACRQQAQARAQYAQQAGQQSGQQSGQQAQSPAWPARTVRMIVPFPPGGSADLLGRAVAQKMTENLGQSVVVENRAGVGGVLGADAVAKSPADGYTLMFQSVTSHGTNPAMYSKTPYSTEKDIQPLAVIASVPLMLVANPNFPAKSIAELIALAKKHIGWYSSGLNSSAEFRAKINLMGSEYSLENKELNAKNLVNEISMVIEKFYETQHNFLQKEIIN